MKSLIAFFCFLLSCPLFAQQPLELLAKLDKGLPLSGRNGSHLGEVVSCIGDVNNDGYDDWAVGLPYAAVYETGAITGKVYIYYGGASIRSNQAPNLILTGEKEWDSFGKSIAHAGDVNHDGYSDILIACSRYVAVYYGGETMHAEVDVVFMEENTSGFFGISTSGAGDVNNDGYDDVIIGSKNHAYLYFGGSQTDAVVDVIVTGESERDMFGFSVSKAGDMNRDGFDDVIIGAQGFYLNGYDAGRAYVYFGSSAMDSTADVIFTGENAGDYFGEVIADAGDVNADGYADVIVSATRFQGQGQSVGRVYIYFGSDAIDTIPNIIVDARPADSFFGGNVHAAGDINHDGFSDILIGSMENNYVFLGSSSMDSVADIILPGSSTIAGKGDYDSDGFSDVITGDPSDDTNGEDAGRVSLYYGGLQMDAAPDAMFYGEPAHDRFGSSVSCAGDLNHDGYDDVIIGAPFSDAGGAGTGSVYLCLGGDNMTTTTKRVVIGQTEYGYLGTSVSCIGDVNGDGSPDVIIGSQGGQARLYLHLFLNYFEDHPADFTFSDGKLGSGFGNSVSSAGDFNRDGHDDFVIGAHCDNTKGTQTGRAYIYFGGPFMGTIPEITLDGETEFDNFGTSVAHAGDVNNDGFSDIVVSAPGYEVNGEKVGRVYVYYGNHVLDSEPDVIITGNSPQSIGPSIAHAGDVNNDGYDDIIVGAPYYGAAPGGFSHVYIYHGGADMDNEPDLIIEKGFGFGAAVCRAGDLNGDGYGDVMIGDGGRVYVYHGGVEMDMVPDIILESEAASSGFGSSLSLAGDINKDGCTDLLIGAPEHSAVGAYNGRAYIYSGKTLSTGTTPNPTVTKSFMLLQNYPNPVNPTTTIRFELAKAGHVTLKVFDLLGREVRMLLDEDRPAGHHSVVFQADGLASGVYVCSLQVPGLLQYRKMVVLR